MGVLMALDSAPDSTEAMAKTTTTSNNNNDDANTATTTNSTATNNKNEATRSGRKGRESDTDNGNIDAVPRESLSADPSIDPALNAASGRGKAVKSTRGDGGDDSKARRKVMG